MAHARNPRRGFTLLELIVVLLILGVLATIAVVAFNTATHKAAVSAASANLTELDHAALADQATTGAGTLSLTALTSALSNASVAVQVGTGAQASWTLLGPTSTAANSSQFAVGFDSGPSTPVVADNGTRMAVVTVADGQGLAIVVTTSGATTKNVGVVPVPAGTTPTQLLHADGPPPPAPTGLAVSNLTYTSGHVTWSAVASADSYDVAVNGSTVATAVTGTATDIAGTAGSTVNVTVRATSAAGSSAWSAAVPATFPVPGMMQLTYNLAASGCTSQTITLDTGTPLQSGGTVDWGDGTVVPFGSTPTHTYVTTGTYQVTVHGQFASYGYPGARSQACLTGVSTWQSTGTTDASYAFYKATNLTSVATPPAGLTKVAHMFDGASTFNGSVAGFDMSAVTDASYMFAHATAFNQPLSTWNTSAVTTMSSMFSYATAFNQPIGGWDVSHVSDFSQMFNRGVFNQPIGTWVPSSATTMAWMFAFDSAFNQDLSGWGSNTGKVTNFSTMFDATPFNSPVNTWSTSSATDMSYMFANDVVFDQDLSSWDVSKVTTLNSTFYEAHAFNHPLGAWHTTSLTSADSVFFRAYKFNQDISTWTMSHVTTLNSMFYQANAFNSPLNAWDTSSVTDMSHLFFSAVAFNQPLSGWNTGKVGSLWETFSGASAFNQPLSTWDTSKVKSMNNTFYSAAKFNQDLSMWSVASTPTHTNFDYGDTATWTLPRPAFTS